MEYKNVLVSCGELSGEIHLSNLVREMKKSHTGLNFFGIGSELLKKEGCRILVDYREISLVGFAEVIKKYFFIRKKLNIIRDFIRSYRIDLVILVDFPGFNFILARYARKFNIRIVYFIPPQIWAWHYSRVKKIREYFDLVIPILPFEKEIYRREKIPFYYHGHPILDNVNTGPAKDTFRKKTRDRPFPQDHCPASGQPGNGGQEQSAGHAGCMPCFESNASRPFF
ncbi:MAG: hypothetical protein PHF84_08895 [bacterium]|nr:hypothetical protein [bacterium]